MPAGQHLSIQKEKKPSGKLSSLSAKKFGDLPLAARREKVGGFFDSLNADWKGQPQTDAVKFLIKLRRGK